MSDTNDLLLTLIASVQTSLKSMEEKFSSMEEKFSSMEEKFSSMEESLKEVKGDLSMATQKLTDLSTKFDENESNWKRAGDTFEIVVRRELRATKGADYARSFKIKDLHGLARIALPKDIRAEDGTYQLCSESEISTLHQQRVATLARTAKENIEALKLWQANQVDEVDKLIRLPSAKKSSKEKFLITKYKSLEVQLSKYDTLCCAAQIDYLACNCLGLWAFSVEAFNSGKTFCMFIFIWTICNSFFVEHLRFAGTNEFVYELETDVRGTVLIRGKRLDITLGEIKGGKGSLNEATGQILKRLCVVGAASTKLLSESPLDIWLHGEIFNCNNWTCTQDIINKEMEKLHLKSINNLSVCCSSV